MPTLHDLMSASIDARATTLGTADASHVDSTRGMISRQRLRNAAVAGGTSALALGGLLAAGLTQASRADNAPASTAPSSEDATAVAHVTTSVEEAATMRSRQVSGELWCDQQIPEPRASSGGFTQDITVRHSILSSQAGPSISTHEGGAVIASLSYEGPDAKPAFVMPASMVIVKDGIVVGLATDASAASTLAPLTSGEEWTTKPVPSDVFGFSTTSCHFPSYPQSTDVVWATGEYQVYVISEAYTSEADVAVSELADQGYRFALDSEGAWAPGSIDCQREGAPSVDWPTPVQCFDPPPAGVTIDSATGEATLPYHLANYGGDLDVTLVSQPISVVLDQDILVGPVSYSSGAVPPLACGEGNDDLTGAFGRVVQFVEMPTLDDLVAGPAAALAVDIRSSDAGQQRGTIHLGEGTTAWVVMGDTLSDYWIAASAKPVITPQDIPIDRLKGYPDVTLTLENYAECPTATEGQWSLTTVDPSTLSTTLVLQGDFTVDWEDGTSTTADWITLSALEQG